MGTRDTWVRGGPGWKILERHACYNIASKASWKLLERVVAM